MPIEDAFVEPALAGGTKFGAGFSDWIGVVGEEGDPRVAIFAIILSGKFRETLLEREEGSLVVDEDVAAPQEPKDFAGGGKDVAMVGGLKVGC